MGILRGRLEEIAKRLECSSTYVASKRLYLTKDLFEQLKEKQYSINYSLQEMTRVWVDKVFCCL